MRNCAEPDTSHSKVFSKQISQPYVNASVEFFLQLTYTFNKLLFRPVSEFSIPLILFCIGAFGQTLSGKKESDIAIALPGAAPPCQP